MYRRLTVLLCVCVLGIGLLPTAVLSHLNQSTSADLVVVGPPQLLTSLPVGATQPVSFAVQIQNSGSTAVETPFFIDLFINPSHIFSDGIPIHQSDGFTAVDGLAAGESITVTVVALAGFGWQPPTHTVYAMADSLHRIDEANEHNNLSLPLLVGDIQPVLDDLQLTGPHMGMPGQAYTFTAVVSPTTLTNPISYQWQLDGTPVLTQSNGTAVSAAFSWPETGTYTVTLVASGTFNHLWRQQTVHITDTAVVDLALVSPLQASQQPRLQPDQPVTFTVALQNVGNQPIDQPMLLALSHDPTFPITAVAQQTVPSLAVGEMATVQFSLPVGLGAGPLQRPFYAIADAEQAIAEANEANNVSRPLPLEVGWFTYLSLLKRP